MAPDLGATLRQIVDKDFLASEKHQAQHWRAVRDGAHPHILIFEAALIWRMRKLGVPLWAHEVWRDAARQKQLYVTGVSQVTDGPHMHGMAVDIVHGTMAWDMPEKAWNLIGHVGKELAIQNGLHIEWGGDWETLWDPAHWEIADWRANKDRKKWPIIQTLKTQSRKLKRLGTAKPPF